MGHAVCAQPEPSRRGCGTGFGVPLLPAEALRRKRRGFGVIRQGSIPGKDRVLPCPERRRTPGLAASARSAGSCAGAGQNAVKPP